MCDVLLLQPRYEIFEETQTYPIGPPLGIGYLAAALEESGLSAKIIDCNIENVSEKKQVERIINLEPKILGINITTPTLPNVYLILRLLEERGFQKPIVLGGPHVTARPRIVGDLKCQFGISGEGEKSLVELSEAIIEGRGKIGDIPQVIINRDGMIVENNEYYIQDINQIQAPARHLFNRSKYRFTHVICSRGCPYQCTYCAMAKTLYRSRKPEDIVDEVECVLKDNVNSSLAFSDDVFTLNKNMVRGICNGILDRNLSLSWSCTTRADIVDEILLREMKAAGCWHISFGIESGIEKIRYALGKRISNRQYTNIFNICHQLGIKTRAYAMMGHPNEGIEDMMETINFIKTLKPYDVFFSLTSIYPKTKLADRALREGKITECVWEENMKKGIGAPIYTPDRVTFEDMRTVLIKALIYFNATPRNILRKIALARSWNDMQDAFILSYGFISNTLSI